MGAQVELHDSDGDHWNSTRQWYHLDRFVVAGRCRTWVRDATGARKRRDQGLILPQGQGSSMGGMKHRPST
jgi:hypothetical protein